MLPLSSLPPSRLAAMIGALAFATIAAAWGFELAGFAPCELCLAQRIPYYAGVPMAAVVALLAKGNQRAGFVVLALLFAGSAVFGLYHAGVEWGFWSGPTACTGAIKPAASIDGFLKDLKTTHVVRCDAVAIRILGLSLAAWNAVVSAALSALAIFGFWRGYNAPSR